MAPYSTNHRAYYSKEILIKIFLFKTKKNFVSQRNGQELLIFYWLGFGNFIIPDRAVTVWPSCWWQICSLYPPTHHIQSRRSLWSQESERFRAYEMWWFNRGLAGNPAYTATSQHPILTLGNWIYNSYHWVIHMHLRVIVKNLIEKKNH